MPAEPGDQRTRQPGLVLRLRGAASGVRLGHRHQLRRGGAVAGILGQASGDQLAQRFGNRRQVGLLLGDAVHDRVHPAAHRPERLLPGGRVRQDRAEAEDVTGLGERITAYLLGRHEARRTDRGAGTRQTAAGHRLQRTRDTEVDDPGAVDGDQDVGRLEVAVDDARGVHRLERAGQPRRQDPYGPLRQRCAAAPAGDDLLEGRARDIARGDPGGLGLGVRVQHRRGPLAADPQRGPHLLPEARPELLLAGQLTAHQLHGDRTPAVRTGQEHLPHPALAEPPDQAVVADPRRIPGPERRQCRAASRLPLLRTSRLLHDPLSSPPKPLCGRAGAGANPRDDRRRMRARAVLSRLPVTTLRSEDNDAHGHLTPAVRPLPGTGPPAPPRDPPGPSSPAGSRPRRRAVRPAGRRTPHARGKSGGRRRGPRR